MTPKQRLEVRAGEIRVRLSELAGIAEQTDETRSEIDTLRVEYGDIERRIGAFTIADDEPIRTDRRDDAEGRELRVLIAEANAGRIFECGLEKRTTDGREAELQQHYGIGAHEIPLEMLETRTVTPAPSSVGASE